MSEYITCGKIGSSGWDDKSSENIPVKSTDGLRRNLVIKVDSEFVLIKSVHGSSISAIRGVAKTKIEQHRGGTQFLIIGEVIG